ncbi:MAG: hypothetical protein JSU83_23150 [Deltaproteobacteria bacterium]|nr:MAG: hypothetical protein JSU83_23150 [Deltaproteobacteria bacterium]
MGKGGGYSDLEYALVKEAGLIKNDTPIVTTVHALQVVEDGQIEECYLSSGCPASGGLNLCRIQNYAADQPVS